MAREADLEAQQVAKIVLRQQLLPIFQVTPCCVLCLDSLKEYAATGQCRAAH